MFLSINPSIVQSTDSPQITVRETVCKTILNKSSISDYSLNCYTGCTHGCVYCYARFMQRFHPHNEPWGKFVDVKINAVEVLKRQLRRAKPGDVFISSACDGWQQIEKERRLTRRCCELLLEFGFKVNLLTKSALVTRDLDIFSGHDVNIGVSIATLDERLRKLWEPQAASVKERLQVIEAARKAGLKTTIMFAPLLPFLSDGRSSLKAMFQQAADLKVDSILVDALNARPRVWPSVAGLLRDHFPELRERYSKIMFDHKMRAEYLSHFRSEVAIAAERLSLTDRVTECF
ncbi:MAG: radical SAM protein [Thermoguttaceae bacterium]|jgi:DNA repair photolyase